MLHSPAIRSARSMAESWSSVRSSIPGMVWPGIPPGSGATLLAMQHQLDETQWWSAEEIQAQQFRQLDRVLRHAREHVPFHAGRLAAAGHDAGRPMTLDAFRALPFMTRNDVRTAGEALRSRVIPKAHAPVVAGETSGSTGTPIRHFGTRLSQFYWHAFALRDHLWHRREARAKLGVIRRGAKEAVHPNWGPPVAAVFETGPCASLDIATDIDSQVDWLAREQPDYLLTNAYNLYWLARRSLERGIRPPALRQARTFGGTFPDDAREVVQQAWNARLVDIYTTEEAGYIALQCPDHEHYHVQAEGVIVEVVDEQGAPCAPGEIGKVVVTTLQNFAMPLIRYEIGDYAEAGAPCPCGRGLPVLKRILGRERNIVTFPDGRRRWPSFPSSKWSHAAPVRQIQLVQRALEHIEVRVAADRALTPGERAALVSALQGCLGYPFEMTVQELPEIPRSAAFKYEDFISEVV